MRRRSQRGTVDPYGDAVVVETVQEGVDEVLPLEEVVPCRIVQIGGHNCRFFPVALPHQLEEGVDLLRL